MGYYDRYRGTRRKRRGRIRILVLVLLLLLAAGVAALYFLQENAIFTAEGFRFPFLDFFQRENAPDPLPSGDDLPDPPGLVIQDPEGNPAEDPSAPGTIDPDPAQPDTPAPPEPDPLPRMTALLTDGAALLANGDLPRQAQEIGYRQLAFQVKPANGQSLVDDGVADGLSPQATAFSQALSQVDLPKIAVFSALRDGVRPRRTYRGSGLHTASGATWLDYDYIAWFDPASAEALTSLTDLINACQRAGFDQVVLQNFQYPVKGRLDLLSYADAAGRQAALTQLAKQLREATDLPLGLVLADGAAAGQADPLSGQDPAQLAQYFDVLYVPAGPEADIAAAEAAAEGTGCRVGLWAPAGEQLPDEIQRDCILVQ